MKNKKRINKKLDNNLFSNEQKNIIISEVIDYVETNPNMLNTSFKKFKKKGFLKEKIKKNILKTLEKVIKKTQRTTSPDELVSIYLEKNYSHAPKDRNLYIDGYANQKKAEMQIGELLELYIQKECYDLGWYCTGTVIEDVDFLRKTNGNLELHQIKLSDNTESKAASKTRDFFQSKHGTKILKWARRNSTSGLENYLKKKEIKNLYYWSEFPEKKLSEKGFRKFIDDYFNNIS